MLIKQVTLQKKDFELLVSSGNANKAEKIATFEVPLGNAYIHRTNRPWALLIGAVHQETVTTSSSPETVTITLPVKVADRPDIANYVIITDGTNTYTPSSISGNQVTFEIPSAGTYDISVYYLPGEGEYEVTIEIPAGGTYIRKVVFSGDIGVLNLRNPLKGKEALYVEKDFTIIERYLFNIEVRTAAKATFQHPKALLRVPFANTTISDLESMIPDFKEALKEELLRM